MSERRVARVQLESPVPQLDRLFDYAVPHPLVADIAPGVRVKVPLRSAGRMMDAFVIEVVADDGSERPLSAVEAVVSPMPVLPERLYTLARRVADRAAGSVSDVLRLAVPKRMVRAEKAWAAAPAPTPPEVVPAALERATATLAPYAGLAAALDAGERIALDAPPHPHGELPRGAWADLLASAAVHTLARGRSAVLVVPDYRDQAQLMAALGELVSPDAIVRDDSDQSGPARYAQYLRTLAPVPCIVVGRRSGVYAPAHDTALVAIWDDGDTLLAEPLAPGVHARDAALVRQEIEGSALLFAGHTRTTDVQRLVEVGYVRDIPQTRRPSPRVVLSATREGEQRQSRVPSSAFAAAREALQHGPVLVQVARPGYAPSLVCADCRRPARCQHCAGPLRAARPGATPVCAWCGRSAHAWACGHCGSTKLRMASSGSERTADELGRAFPNTRVIVADGAHPVAEVDAAPALVIATRGAEPLARGGYRAVILLDGDRMLQNEALRIAEHCLRWWSNAAALAAPGAPVHLVGVAGPVARALATWTQPAYARAELLERLPLRMPPAVRVASVDGHARSVDVLLESLRESVPDLDALAILGPVDTSADPDTSTSRALVRFDYAHGRAVADALRAGVIADALRARKSRKDRGPKPRSTLRVRLDIPEPDL
ncbi:primosomal protein N' (replication factor Y) [Microbacterium testaceum]|uniref:primosomal protein N' family DNA-binding protein n=1 Tax=Microbacterium TaxID=33882 RepID=UPI002785D24E|nr:MULTISPECIES: primosomal protein N' [Microbacterium]MDQ1113657.1 primosomal protein N' (replication factor Y) [Microbacterium testaceum]MDR6099242.1 primosomal protein N' (replication factor Y) [Microbacterium sp. SORGH_AS_0454]